MAIFDKHTVRYLTYYIVLGGGLNGGPGGGLGDAAQVAALNALYPDGYQFAPFNPGPPAGGAAIAFNASWSGTTDAPIAPFLNYVWSPEWTATNAYPQNVATFTRHSGGIFGIGGSTVTYYWVGRFVYKPPDVPPSHPPHITNIPRRRWLEGFEDGNFGALGAGASGSGVNCSPDASRHVGGLGLAIRGNTTVSIGEITVAKYQAGLVPQHSWERMYLRCRQTDPGVANFWQSSAVESANFGFQLGVQPAGTPGFWQLVVSKEIAGFYTVLTASPNLPIFTGGPSSTSGFTKVDLIQDWGTQAPGRLRVFFNGVQVIDITVSGAGPQYHHRASIIGNAQGTANSMYLDIDDWMCADVPNNGGTEELASRDWLNGTKIALLRPTTFGSAHDGVAWTGAVQALLNNPQNILNTFIGNTLTSSTALALLEANTDSDLVVDGNGALGCPAMLVCLESSSVAGTDGVLRPTTLPANTVVAPATIDQTVAMGPNQVLASVDGTVAVLPDWTPIKLRFTKANDANAVVVQMLHAQVELTGTWWAEDYRTVDLPTPPPTFQPFKGSHNQPYPRSPWVKNSLSGPESPYLVYSGTYVGNGTQQDLTFAAPVHFFFVRPTSASTGGNAWSSTMMGAHNTTDRMIRSEIVAVDEDATFLPGADPDTQQHRYRIRITGTNSQINQNAITFHYLAICDPGGRFLLNFHAACKSTEPAFAYNLVNSNFLADFILGWPGSITGISTGRPFLKGPASLADDVSSFNNQAKIASALTNARGVITLQANLLANAPNFWQDYLLFRKADGNNDPGQPGVMAVLSWTGDGTASRTIGIAPASGLRPVWAIAGGDDSLGGYMRDAAHTTNTSSKYDGSSVTTAITGASIDSISVGALLNVNGVNYNMLVFLGSATNGNGGFSPDGTFAPVQVDAPVDGPWAATPDPAIFNPVVPPIPLVGEPDLDQLTVLSNTATMINGLLGGSPCETYTRKIANLALSRIGISQVINDLVVDQTQPAVIARRHILECINATLRGFDWPFATAYETLVVVGGTSSVPVNADWQYSYRAPNKLIKARRLVPRSGAKRAYDERPIEFRITSDSLGTLIYTDEPTSDDTPLVLEFTTRISCPALFGDPMFREAVSWRLASDFAASLARDSAKQKECLQVWEGMLKSAEVPAANESQQAPEGNAPWINARDGGTFDVDDWLRRH